jgi:hypothetical protein
MAASKPRSAVIQRHFSGTPAIPMTWQPLILAT